MNKNILKILLILLLICVNCINTTNGEIQNKKNNNLRSVSIRFKNGFIDTEGNLVIDAIYDYVTEFYEDLAEIKINGEKHAFIDIEGNIIIDLNLKTIVYTFSEGLAGIAGENKRGYINKNGILFLNIDKTFANTFSNFSEGLAEFEKNKKSGYFDKTGKVVIKPQYDVAWDFQEGIAVVGNRIGEEGYVLGEEDLVLRDFLFGFINKTGEPITDIIYKGVRSFSNEYAWVSAEDGIYFINKEGKRMFEHINGIPRGSFKNGLAPYYFYGVDKLGYINTDGEVAIKPVFMNAEEFSEGMARVTLEQFGLWGYINTDGEMVIESKFKSCEDFFHGLAKIRLDEMIQKTWNGYINKKGELVWPKE